MIERGKRGLFAMQANRLSAAALARALSEEFAPADYSFVVKRRGNPPKPWRWEIYCACSAIPDEMPALLPEGWKADISFCAAHFRFRG